MFLFRVCYLQTFKDCLKRPQDWCEQGGEEVRLQILQGVAFLIVKKIISMSFHFFAFFYYLLLYKVAMS